MHWLDRAELNADLADLDAGYTINEIHQRATERRALDDHDQGPDHFLRTR